MEFVYEKVNLLTETDLALAQRLEVVEARLFEEEAVKPSVTPSEAPIKPVQSMQQSLYQSMQQSVRHSKRESEDLSLNKNEVTTEKKSTPKSRSPIQNSHRS